MKKTLSVAAIHNGTVIDHIASDQTLRIMHMLKLLKKKLKVTVGFNLPSKRLGFKDLIKIENHELTPDEANQIIVLAPNATINIIRDYDVMEKLKTSLPEYIQSIFICPNRSCVTRTEKVDSCFTVEEMASQVKLVCRYCEKSFERTQVGVIHDYC